MRRLQPTLLLLLFIMLANGCSAGTSDGSQQNGNEHTPTPPVQTDPIKDKLSAMSLEQKLGQMIIAGVSGTTVDDQSKKLITDSYIGGVILYKNNIVSVEQTTRLLNGLKEANRTNAAPLLLSVDQEGGKVNRLPTSLVATPSSRDIAKSGDSKKARAVGETIGDQLRTLGFNVNFAPVLDIDSNPNNPVIGSRSFGPTAAVVSSFGLEEMLGLRAKQVIPVVKHFPGHGDTSVDSHLELPVVNKTLDQLRKLELVPFAEAIRSNAEAVMVAHILLPSIDPDYPASMSSNTITQLLRNEMGYDGVVITDDMTMGAIMNHYDLGKAVVQSVRAGSDIVLVAHEYANVRKALESLMQAAKSGEITMERIDQSVRRIIKLKQQYRLTDTGEFPEK